MNVNRYVHGMTISLVGPIGFFVVIYFIDKT